jgi:hypothetical protein
MKTPGCLMPFIDSVTEIGRRWLNSLAIARDLNAANIGIVESAPESGTVNGNQKRTPTCSGSSSLMD